MALMAMWEITITCRDGSRLRFTEQRGDPPQKGEIFEADVTDLTEHDAAFLAAGRRLSGGSRSPCGR